MKIKSYFASSVEQAIQEARQELGTDAMLITSRRSSPETRSLGAYEVVFGLQAPSARTTRPSAARPADLVQRAAKPARATPGNQEHAARRAASGVSVVGSAKSSSRNWFHRSGPQHCAGNSGRGGCRLRDQLSRDQPAHAARCCEPMPRS